MLRDLKAEGAPPEVIAAYTRPPFALWDVNAPVFRLFDALGTQWRCAGMGGARAGLDYTAIEPTARLVKVDLVDGVFDGLRAMEHAALDVWAEKRQREAPPA